VGLALETLLRWTLARLAGRKVDVLVLDAEVHERAGRLRLDAPACPPAADGCRMAT